MQVPAVVAAGGVYQRPFANGPIGMDTGVLLEGQPLTAEGFGRNPMVNWEAVTAGYFSAMGIRLLQGRLFTDADRENAVPAVIVSERLARRLWPGLNPIGRRLLTMGAPGDEQHPRWRSVVGVVADARYREVEAPRYDLYLPHRQAPELVRYFVLRVSGDPMSIVPELKAAFATIDTGITVAGVSTMNDIVNSVFAPWRFSTVVFTIFSVMALAFAGVGVAALIAYAVTQRTREIGVRMALGAQTYQVVALLVREGFWMTAGGLMVGLSIAWVLRQSIASLLFGVSAADPITFTAVPVVLSLCALIAIYLPARRAARIDPAVTLRHD
jgi:putative ABC transport system permease protein